MYRCSKIPLHKNFKLVLEQNVRKQTYPTKSCRLQNDLVRLKHQQLYLVKRENSANWLFKAGVESIHVKNVTR